ncbi:MAG: hypothetical protein IRZ09_12855 [Variibacter sp.]|nr:hypothetical protein [Variibacter sp.]
MRAGIAPSERSLSRPLVLAGVAAAGLLVAGLWGWAQYGAAVFYEMILSGLAFCL